MTPRPVNVRDETPMAFVRAVVLQATRIRPEQLKELLSRTPKSLKQIALLLGFSSEKTFARAFRRWEGVLPSVFRTTPTTPTTPRNATD